MDNNISAHTKQNRIKAILEVLIVSAKLGLTSFGGPIAHLGYFHEEYVRRRKWLDEKSYADLVALCQFLPGPASSQVGIGIGVMRTGLWGGVAAWLGFTLPSVLALVLCALYFHGHGSANGTIGWIHGLKLVAVAVVAQAITGMGKSLAPDRTRATIAIAAAILTLLWQTAISQIVVISLAAAAGLFLYQDRSASVDLAPERVPVKRSTAVVCLALFFGLLVFLPVLRNLSGSHWIAVFDSFYRSGSLVFGGGHVVLPLLEREVVPSGWVAREDFLVGYGLTQAVPGPLFTFAAYLGATMGGVAGAAIATLGIFLPAFLLIVGALPFWGVLRRMQKAQAALLGINAAVVGILLAAFYNPIWTSTILAPIDFAVASFLYLLLVFWKTPPWVVVALGACAGALLPV